MTEPNEPPVEPEFDPDWRHAVEERWREVDEDVAAAKPRPPHDHPVDQWMTESVTDLVTDDEKRGA